MCPTAEVEQRYVNGWLHNDDYTGTLYYGARHHRHRPNLAGDECQPLRISYILRQHHPCAFLHALLILPTLFIDS